MLDDLSLQQMLFRVAAIIFVSGVHGFALAGFARLLGDPGPAHDGRLTVNPFAHLAVLGVVAAIASRMGWIRPMDVRAASMRGKLLGLLLCVLLSLAVLPLVAAAAMALRPIAAGIADPALARYAIVLLSTFAEVAVWVAILNLVPLPPLTAGLLLKTVAPGLGEAIARQETIVSLALAAMLVLGGGERIERFAAPFARWLLP